MSARMQVHSVLSTPRRALARSAVVVLAGLAAASFATSTVLADDWMKHPPAAAAVGDQRAAALDSFDATGLPSGPARGIPQRATLPAGFNLKHVHGGPSYVYVMSGSVDIIDGDRTTTYEAGDFFWEPVGHVHTAKTSETTELFILRFLSPGAEGTIPVQ